MINQLQQLMPFRLMILVIQFEKLTTTQKLKILKKIPDHDKYITTQEFNKQMTENFAERLKQVKSADKNDFAIS